MIAETVIEALIAETVRGFNKNDGCFFEPNGEQ